MDENITAREANALAELNEERARAYLLLSRLFEREVDAALVAHLTAPGAFETEDSVMSEAFDALREGVGAGDEQRLEELAVAFNRVFFGMGPRTAKKAFPYESVYTSQKGLMMQDAYVDARHAYRAEGWEKSPDFTEPDDHIAVELTFMATCCTMAAAALREGDEAAEAHMLTQRAFLDRHLLNWVDRFALDVQAADEGFYGYVAALLLSFLRADRALLAEVIS